MFRLQPKKPVPHLHTGESLWCCGHLLGKHEKANEMYPSHSNHQFVAFHTVLVLKTQPQEAFKTIRKIEK